MRILLKSFTRNAPWLIGSYAYFLFTSSVLAQCAWDPVIQTLSVRSDERSRRAADNLSHICSTVTAGDIQASIAAKKCLGPTTRIFTETDSGLLRSAFGKITAQSLRGLIPSVATLLGGPVATAITVFLTPQEIGKDAIDVISNPDRNSKDDLVKAARLLIWDTNPQAFRDKLAVPRKAAIAACVLAQ